MTGQKNFCCSNCSITLTSAVVIATMVTSNMSYEVSIVKADVSYQSDKGDSSLLTDTIAAIVSAIMALVFVILVVCIIRAVHRRRQETRGSRLGQPIIQTIASGTFGAHLPAYRHVPVSNTLSWEIVTSSPDHNPGDVNEHSPSGPSLSEAFLNTPSSSNSLPNNSSIHQIPSTSKATFVSVIDVASTSHSISTYEDPALHPEATKDHHKTLESVGGYHCTAGNSSDQEQELHSSRSQEEG